MDYFSKMKGTTKSPPAVGLSEIFWSWIGSLGVMHATKTLHPPSGATALIAVIGSQKIHNLGYWYAFIPGGIGPIIMLVVALLVNNIPKNRRYPEFWL